MTNRLVTTADAAAVAICAAAASLPMPPLAGAVGIVPAQWTSGTGAPGAGTVPGFDLEIWAPAALSLTLAELVGGVLHPLVVADDTFTAVHGTEIFTAVAHGLQTGDGPIQLTNSGGALPAGLSTATDYYVIRIDADTFYLAASRADALAGTKVLITDNGTGTHTLVDTADTMRVHWHSHGLLGSGTIALDASRAYTVRCAHRPQVVAYAVVATVSTSTVSARMLPVEER